MEEIPTIQNSNQIQPEAKKSGTSELLFFGKIIFSVFVPLILILNYFNILKLSEIFPNYLGFLPHKPYEQYENLNIKVENQGFPTPIADYSPINFQYDEELAKTILTSFIKDNIKPQFLPENLDIKQGLNINNSINENQKFLFGAYLDNNNETISITFHYIQATNTPNYFMIFIHPKKTDQPSLNSTIANSLISSYFNNPIPIENCNTKGTASNCKVIKIESDGKREFGAIIGLDTSKSPPIPASTLFACFIPKDSNIYNTLKSCVTP